MPSLRSSGNIVGGSVSIRELAQEYKLSSPLSVRQLIGALGVPPYQDGGFIRKKVVPLEIFQRKFDEFVNERSSSGSTAKSSARASSPHFSRTPWRGC